MRIEDFGYDAKTMIHSKLLTRQESVFVGVLWGDHVGRKNALSGRDLAIKYAYGLGFDITGSSDAIDEWKRDVRYMQNHLLRKHDHIAVLSMPGTSGGYFIAANDEEAKQFYHSFRQRGMTGLVKATAGKKQAMVEAVEQLAFEFEDLVDRTMPGEAKELQGMRQPIAPEIVDNLLAKMSMDPEQFASSLRKIRDKFFSGAVLLDKERVAAIRAKTAELQGMLEGLG